MNVPSKEEKDGVERGYYIPNLPTKPWWTMDELGLNISQEMRNYIRGEFFQVKKAKEQRHSIFDRIDTLTTGDWKAIYLMKKGLWNMSTAKSCPITMSYVNTLPIMEHSVFGQIYFSILRKGVKTDPHKGPTNSRLRIQIPLILPEAEEDEKCEIIVNGERKFYEQNEVLIFDDSFLHSVSYEGKQHLKKVFSSENPMVTSAKHEMKSPNEGNQSPEKLENMRVVLVIDIWHPNITQEMKQNFQRFHMTTARSVSSTALETSPIKPDSMKSLEIGGSASPPSPLPPPPSHERTLPLPSLTDIHVLSGESSSAVDSAMLPPPIKILIIAPHKVGKTQLMIRYCKRQFVQPSSEETKKDSLYDTNTMKSINYLDTRVKVNDSIYCVSFSKVEEEWNPFSSHYFSNIANADGIILAYDVTDFSSFENLETFLSETYLQLSAFTDTPTILLGLKNDAETREVTVDDVEGLAIRQSIPYFECSSLTGEGVDEAINYLILQLVTSPEFLRKLTKTPSNRKLAGSSNYFNCTIC